MSKARFACQPFDFASTLIRVTGTVLISSLAEGIAGEGQGSG